MGKLLWQGQQPKMTRQDKTGPCALSGARCAEWSPGSAQGQLSGCQTCLQSQGWSQVKPGIWVTGMTWVQAQPQCTSSRGPGQELELKCSSQAKQRGHAAGLLADVSHPLAYHKHLIQGDTATPHPYWPPAQALRPLLRVGYCGLNGIFGSGCN